MTHICLSGVSPEVLLVKDREEREELEVEAADLARPGLLPPFFPEFVTGVNIFRCVVFVGVRVVVLPDIELF